MTGPFVLSASAPAPENSPLFALVFSLLLFGILGVLIFKTVLIQKREDVFRAWAKGNGLKIRWEDNIDFKKEYPEFRCLWKGSGQSMTNLADGVRGNNTVHAFDYCYHAGGDGDARYFSAIILDMDIPLDPFFVCPEIAKKQLVKILADSDIDVSLSEYSRRFFVRLPDKNWTKKILHQGIMAFLMSSPDFTVEYGGKSIIAYTERMMPIPDFDKALQLLEGIVRRLPGDLPQDGKKSIPPANKSVGAIQ